jgi:hypothetical protein
MNRPRIKDLPDFAKFVPRYVINPRDSGTDKAPVKPGDHEEQLDPDVELQIATLTRGIEQ